MLAKLWRAFKRLFAKPKTPIVTPPVEDTTAHIAHALIINE